MNLVDRDTLELAKLLVPRLDPFPGPLFLYSFANTTLRRVYLDHPGWLASRLLTGPLARLRMRPPPPLRHPP
eukprot:scaffold63831_cov28-Tisochrysis_lutea.AAC.3